MTISKVIAYTGRAGSGKGYACQEMVDKYGFLKLSFADVLRKVLFETLGFTSYEEAMKNYDELKRTKLYNDRTLRNMLEDLGSCLRNIDEDIFAKAMIRMIERRAKSTIQYNICIDDLRYENEYFLVKEFCEKNNISFSLVLKDYHSERYDDSNKHESARMSNYLVEHGFEDNAVLNDFIIAGYKAYNELQKSGGKSFRTLTN
jgi:adenylate kinase family enzyme